jgi:hypothetical protein
MPLALTPAMLTTCSGLVPGDLEPTTSRHYLTTSKHSYLKLRYGFGQMQHTSCAAKAGLSSDQVPTCIWSVGRLLAQCWL